MCGDNVTTGQSWWHWRDPEGLQVGLLHLLLTTTTKSDFLFQQLPYPKKILLAEYYLSSMSSTHFLSLDTPCLIKSMLWKWNALLLLYSSLELYSTKCTWTKKGVSISPRSEWHGIEHRSTGRVGSMFVRHCGAVECFSEYKIFKAISRAFHTKVLGATGYARWSVFVSMLRWTLVRPWRFLDLVHSSRTELGYKIFRKHGMLLSRIFTSRWAKHCHCHIKFLICIYGETGSLLVVKYNCDLCFSRWSLSVYQDRDCQASEGFAKHIAEGNANAVVCCNQGKKDLENPKLKIKFDGMIPHFQKRAACPCIKTW